MSNSATSAAKRRRAGPLLSSPLFQAPQSFQSNKPIVDNNLNLQPDRSTNAQPSFSEPQSQVPDSKFMTVQQVINLITTRLIAVENFVNEFGDKPRQFNAVVSETNASNAVSAPVNVDYNKIAEICKSLMEEHISEFDHRYAVLAEEISNLKNITLSLQSYTMEVNKLLLEERGQKKETVEEEKNEYANEDVPNIEFQFESEAQEELVSAEPLVMEETQSEETQSEEAQSEEAQSEPLSLEEKQSEEAQSEPLSLEEKQSEETISDKDESLSPSEDATEDPFSINIVSKKNKKGGKKAKAVEQEQQLLA